MSMSPVFGSTSVPMVVKAGLAVWITLFLAVLVPSPLHVTHLSWMSAGLMIGQEAIIGLALGLAARMVFLGIHQGGAIIAQQMGLSDAGVIDPNSGEESESIGTFLEMVITILFLSVGGHQLLISLVVHSYKVFPPGAAPDIGALTGGLVTAGSAMLTLGLNLAGPFIAGFVILSVVLAIIARALPEMNILYESYPLRVGLGLLLTTAIMPMMNEFTSVLTNWMGQLLPAT
jgi:flagellar biosynthesis protein FliR